jgi:hypothetical protein
MRPTTIVSITKFLGVGNLPHAHSSKQNKSQEKGRKPIKIRKKKKKGLLAFINLSSKYPKNYLDNTI